MLSFHQTLQLNRKNQESRQYIYVVQLVVNITTWHRFPASRAQTVVSSCLCLVAEKMGYD